MSSFQPTSARLVWAWKNTASLWLHLGHGWSSVLGKAGSAMTSDTIWVNSLKYKHTDSMWKLVKIIKIITSLSLHETL